MFRVCLSDYFFCDFAIQWGKNVMNIIMTRLLNRDYKI